MKRSSFVIIFFLNLFGFHKRRNIAIEFLSIGVGARGWHSRTSLTAITNDVTSGYWNPAGLSRMEQKYQLSLMHAAYFANIANYDYAALSL